MALTIPDIINTPEKRRTLALRYRVSLLVAAAQRQERARHYDDFKVGAALLTVNTFGSIRIAKGLNVKLRKGAHKQCAEMTAFASACGHDDHFWIIAVAIYGNPMVDDVSGVKEDTLPSCAECRKMFVNLLQESVDRENPDLGMMVDEEALIFTTVPGTWSQHGEILVQPAEDTNTLHEMLKNHQHPHPCCYAIDPTPTPTS